MDSKTKKILIGIVIFLAVMWMIQAFLSEAVVIDLPYSEFKENIRNNRITEVILTDTHIIGKGADRKEYKSIRVEDNELVGLLEEKKIKYEGRIEDNWLRTFFLSWIIPIALLVIIWNILFKKMSPNSKMMSFGKSKVKAYVEEDVRVTFSDVAGQVEPKEELCEVISFLKKPEKFTRIGGRMPKGILLVGPPGTGKTLLAKAVAGESQVPFFSLSGSEFVELFVGMGAQRVRDLFAQAKEKAPCIIFIDELDAIGKTRGHSLSGSNDEREQTLNQLLAEMDGFDTKAGIIIIAATNRPEILDKALLRAGRFDRNILVDRPDLKDREEILKLHIKNIKIAEDVDINTIAKRTPGFVGADIANLVNEAALLAVRRGKEEVTTQEFEMAIDRIIAGLERKNRIITPKEKKIIAYHESGHAIAGYFSQEGETIHKISIVPRGLGALGFTMQVPIEDRFLYTKKELFDKIDTLLGGRAAEEVIFDQVSTGAQNDLERATEIAFKMITEYGMSQKLGPIAIYRKRLQYLDNEMGYQSRMETSEQTAQIIDEEVKSIINSAMIRAKQILTDKKPLLEALAARLLEKEVIEAEEFMSIIRDNMPQEEKPGVQ